MLQNNGNETVLHSFNGTDGFYPYGGLTRDNAGQLYGTTQYGGDFNCEPQYGRGCGTVFKVIP